VLIRLILLLTVVPFVELVILLKLADRFSWQKTLALVILTGVVGAWLARREGLKALTRIQADLERGEMPTDSMIDGVMILAAGLLLVTPGILTDACGFALLIPPVRRLVRRRLAESFHRRIIIIHPDGDDAPVDGDTFIDVEPKRHED